MSWPVRYGEVATLAQEFLEGLKAPQLQNVGVQAPVPDGQQSLFNGALVHKRMQTSIFSKNVEGCRNGRAKNHMN